MPTYTLSSNMSLPVPIVGTTPGPDYASDINSCLTLIDQHDHSSGYGAMITPTGININASLPFANNNAITLRSVRFTSQASPLALAADLGCLYESGVDLYYNDGNGNQVRLTQSGSVAGVSGSIANLTSPASATYVSGTSTFVWQSAANTSANMDGGSVIIRNVTAAANGVTISAPNALASSYTVTLPAAPPASQKIMTMDASGNVSAPYTVDNSTITIAANVIGVPASGIGTSQIAALAVTAAKIAANTITSSQIANATITTTQISASAAITGSQLSSSLNLPTATQVNSRQPIVNNTSTASALSILRGTATTSGSVSAGEGFTISGSDSTHITIAFTTTFAETPVVVATADANQTVWTSSVGFNTATFNFDAGPTAVSFIIIGRR